MMTRQRRATQRQSKKQTAGIGPAFIHCAREVCQVKAAKVRTVKSMAVV